MKYSFEKKVAKAKPCPFCGSVNVVTGRKDFFEQSSCKTCSIIRCADCGVQVVGEPVLNDDGTFVQDYDICQRQVLTMWNRRTA